MGERVLTALTAFGLFGEPCASCQRQFTRIARCQREHPLSCPTVPLDIPGSLQGIP